MKQTGFWMVVIVLVLAGVFPALAQDATPEVPDFFAGLPECTDQEALDALNLLQDEFMDDYKVVTDALSAGVDGGETAKLVDTMQRQWWSEVAPQFPACAASMRIMFAAGKTLDELLITLLESPSDEVEFILATSEHLTVWGVYSNAIFDEVAALAE